MEYYFLQAALTDRLPKFRTADDCNPRSERGNANPRQRGPAVLARRRAEMMNERVVRAPGLR